MATLPSPGPDAGLWPRLADLAEPFGAALADAADGRDAGAHAYAQLWRTAVERLRDDIEHAEPNRRDRDDLRLYLTNTALRAPFSGWAHRLGGGNGVIQELLTALWSWRRLPSPAPPETLPEPRGLEWGPGAPERFLAVVAADLLEPWPLDVVATHWSLTDTEVGRLFGVTRQAITGWRARTPESRGTKILTLQRIDDLLFRYLEPDRLPAIVRQRAEAYGDRSMLQMITAGEEEALLGVLERAFDWSATA